MNKLTTYFKKQPTACIVFFLFLAGFLLRVLGLLNITLAGDFQYHWSVAQQIVEYHEFPLLGPAASVNDQFHLGPFYYYLLSLPYFLGQGNFQVAIIFFSLINSLSIFVFYAACRNWFTQRESLLSTTLYTFSAYMITIQNFPWNPNILPTLLTLIWWCITKIQHQHTHYFPLLTLLVGLSLQAHATAIFLLPVIFFLINIKKIPFKYWVGGLTSFLIVMSPWIYIDLQTHFGQSQQALQVFTPGPTDNCSFSFYLQHHGHGEHCFAEIRNTLFIGRMFTMSLFATRHLGIVFATLCIVIVGLFKIPFPHRKDISIWLLLPWFLFMLYSSNIYLHYLLIFFPIPFLLLVQFLEHLKQQLQLSDRIINLVYLLLILGNLLSYGLSLQVVRS